MHGPSRKGRHALILTATTHPTPQPFTTDLAARLLLPPDLMYPRPATAGSPEGVLRATASARGRLLPLAALIAVTATSGAFVAGGSGVNCRAMCFGCARGAFGCSHSCSHYRDIRRVLSKWEGARATTFAPSGPSQAYTRAVPTTRGPSFLFLSNLSTILPRAGPPSRASSSCAPLLSSLFFPFSPCFLLSQRLHHPPSPSGMDAGRAYNTWPLMGGQLVPDEYWGWEGLGLTPLRNMFENTAAVQFNHRCGHGSGAVSV